MYSLKKVQGKKREVLELVDVMLHVLDLNSFQYVLFYISTAFKFVFQIFQLLKIQMQHAVLFLHIFFNE